MLDRKLRILHAGEASFLSTGFGTYTNEVLKRLHSTNKYELAEHACYAPYNDSRIRDVPWKYYNNMPLPGEEQAYSSDPHNQFGKFKFNQTLLNFKPDVVFTVLDPWMSEYIQQSPLRRYFHLSIMPTVDSAPLMDSWIEQYIDADSVFSYTDWGLNVLRKEGGGKINTICSTPPGADLEVFKPLDKRATKESLGIPGDSLVLGTVMRNQQRKLYPDLIKAFEKYMELAPKSMADKSYLLMHTSFPDVGWDIARLVKESSVGSRCLFTYTCKRCGGVFCVPFQDVRGGCRRCGETQCYMPNSAGGLDRASLNAVYNGMDAYVQYSVCEGFGMGLVEAAATGLHVFGTDYSAMEDVVRKLNGTPIKVERMFRDIGTHSWRALPDNQDFVNKLIDFFKLPSQLRKIKGISSRKAVEQYYTYEKTTSLWEKHFDSLSIENKWSGKPKLHSPAQEVPNGLSDSDFVKWCVINVMGEPEKINSFATHRMIRDLERGVVSSPSSLTLNDDSALGSQRGWKQYGRNEVYSDMYSYRESANHWESMRAQS